VNYYLSAFIIEYVNAPADTNMNKIKPVRINSN